MKRKLRVTVEGVSYDVEVEVLDGESKAGPAEAAAPIASAKAEPTAASPAAAASVPSATGPGVVASPLAGRVVEVAAKVGQDVKEGDQLMTLEAMKMNTFVFAPQDGKVSEILVASGDAVEEGQALLKMG